MTHGIHLICATHDVILISSAIYLLHIYTIYLLHGIYISSLLRAITHNISSIQSISHMIMLFILYHTCYSFGFCYEICAIHSIRHYPNILLTYTHFPSSEEHVTLLICTIIHLTLIYLTQAIHYICYSLHVLLLIF